MSDQEFTGSLAPSSVRSRIEGEDISGEDALVATADLLIQKLLHSARLAHWAHGTGHDHLHQLSKQIHGLLLRPFGSSDWPAFHRPPLIDDDVFEGFEDAILEATRRRIPLGEDVLASAVKSLSTGELKGDRRVIRLIDDIRNSAAPPPPSPEPAVSSSPPSAAAPDVSVASSPSSGLASAAQEMRMQPLENKAAPLAPPRRMAEADANDSRSNSKDSSSIARPSKEPARRLSKGPSKHAPDVPDPDLPVPKGARNAGSDAMEISVDTLEELTLDPAQIEAIRAVWDTLCKLSKSREQVGEMIFSALFEAAPSLQALFTTPRAVQAMKFMSALQGFIIALDSPAKLKSDAETLGFGHLQLEVTTARVAVFRDSILELFEVEAGNQFTPEARAGWAALLNYVGGAMIFVKSHYADRLRILMESWELANASEEAQETKVRKDAEAGAEESGSFEGEENGVEPEPEANADTVADRKRSKLGGFLRRRSKEAIDTMYGNGKDLKKGDMLNGKSAVSAADEQAGKKDEKKKAKKKGEEAENTSVPKTYAEMFLFNAAVMGFGNSTWMREVLASFDSIVKNVSNNVRLQEECDVLCLRINKCAKGNVNLGEYKRCMLAALRSMLPKVWNSKYEVAWTWLWENVERLLSGTLSKPQDWEKALEHMMDSFDESQKYEMRKAIFERFFQLAPAGQNYLKQSQTRLIFIGERIMDMVLDLYREPWKMVSEISSLGLRHVGYGIPTDLVGPFVTGCIEVVTHMSDDEQSLEAYRWSISLVAKILVRTIAEGSTIVMKAINANSTTLLRKAVACAPRGRRAEWLLKVQVGTESISPLSWAIESGRHEAAKEIIKDLLTIRADREKYYYGVDELFARHPDIVERLVTDAKMLLQPLFDGLVWRSRRTKNQMRRVNYYVKHLVVNQDGDFAEAIHALCKANDQAIVSHPVIVLVCDTLWSGVVRRQFILSKIGFLFGLVVFMLSQAVLPKTGADNKRSIRIAIFAGRLITYSFNMVRLIALNGIRTITDYRKNDVIRIWCLKIPRFLHDMSAFLSFLLMLLLMAMCTLEPMLWCITSGDWDNWPPEECETSADKEEAYRICSMLAMIMHWVLLIDLDVFSPKLAAFVLVFRQVLSEVGTFLVAMSFLMCSFGSAITCLRHGKEEFDTLRESFYCLFAITVGLYEGDYRELQHQPWLLLMVLLFLTLSGILLINLLIAQLNCTYEYVYQDSVAFARLSRATLIVEIIATCPPSRWRRYVTGLRLEHRLEFDEGDVGLCGGIQVREPSSLHPVNVDTILRFGGNCSADMQWPEHEEKEDRFERVERLMQRTLKVAAIADRNAAKGFLDGGDGYRESRGDSRLTASSASSSASSTGSEEEREDEGSPTSPVVARKSERKKTLERKAAQGIDKETLTRRSERHATNSPGEFRPV